MKKHLLTLCAACLVATTFAQTSFEARVAQNVDDAEEFTGETSQGPAGTVYLDSSDLELFEDAGTLQVVGLRFENVTIPQGAMITAAYLQFTVDETSDKATSITVQGEASDNATVFTEAPNDISSRPRTTAAVTWSPAPWTQVDDAGADQQSPSLTEVVQEIIDQPGWQSGNALAFILSGTGQRVARSFDGRERQAPLLRIDYETGEAAAPTDTTPAGTPPVDTTTAETTPTETTSTENVATPAPVTPEVPTAPQPAAPETAANPAPQPATPTPQPAQPEVTAPTSSSATLENPRTRNRQIRYPISPVGDNSVRGSLFVADYGDSRLVLTLFVSGQAASEAYRVKLLRGDCGDAEETLLALEPAQGERGGLSVTTVQLSFAALTNADLHINLYTSADGSDAVVACGEVGAQ